MFFLGRTELASHTRLRSVFDPDSSSFACKLAAQGSKHAELQLFLYHYAGFRTTHFPHGRGCRPTRPQCRCSASAAFILITRAHGASQASPSASMVAPLQSRQWRLSGSQKRPGHHRRLLGDLFLERKRLEIRMMGENISGRVATQSGIRTPGRASSSNRHIHVLNQSSQSALTLAADFPSPLCTLAAFAHPSLASRPPLPQFEPLWPPSFHSMNSIFPGTSRCSGKSGNKIGFPSRTKVATSRSSVAI